MRIVKLRYEERADDPTSAEGLIRASKEILVKHFYEVQLPFGGLSFGLFHFIGLRPEESSFIIGFLFTYWLTQTQKKRESSQFDQLKLRPSKCQCRPRKGEYSPFQGAFSLVCCSPIPTALASSDRPPAEAPFHSGPAQRVAAT